MATFRYRRPSLSFAAAILLVSALASWTMLVAMNLPCRAAVLTSPDFSARIPATVACPRSLHWQDISRGHP